MCVYRSTKLMEKMPLEQLNFAQQEQLSTRKSSSPNVSINATSPSPAPSLTQGGGIGGNKDSPSLLHPPQHQHQLFVKRSPSPAVGLLQSAATGRSPSPSVAHMTSNEGPPPSKRKKLFHRELKYMMHGFGDDPNPYSETVDLVEELVIQFITEMTVKAMEVGKSGRVHVNDIIFIIRKDPKKYSRVKDLLMMKEQIDKAKKAFSDDSEPLEL